MDVTNIKLTNSRLVFLRTLKDGPKTWRDIKIAYYGPERSKTKSHNSFQQQKNKLLKKGIIREEDGHYELTDLGRQLLSIVDDAAMDAAKSLAQIRFEKKQINLD